MQTVIVPKVPRDAVPRDDAILAALAAGPLSSAALVAATGLGQRRCERGLRRLQDLGYVVSPVYGTYRLTDLGQTVLPDGRPGSAETRSTPPLPPAPPVTEARPSEVRPASAITVVAPLVKRSPPAGSEVGVVRSPAVATTRTAPESIVLPVDRHGDQQDDEQGIDHPMSTTSKVVWTLGGIAALVGVGLYLAGQSATPPTSQPAEAERPATFDPPYPSWPGTPGW